MADFRIAFHISIIENEGGYNPGIGEKETYMGIDRGANPNWNGWVIIDNFKINNPKLNISKINLLLSQNIALQSSIERFYKINYWAPLNLDFVHDQQLANNLFDCAVNQGDGFACKLMQLACNSVIVNSNSLIKPLIVDRKIGPTTLSAFNNLSAPELNNEINYERLKSYRHDAGYKEWGKVWEKRLTLYT